MKAKLVVSLVVVALGCLGASIGWAQMPGHVMVTPGDLKWQAVPFTFRLKLPADYRIPAHWHPAVEHVTVISGAFHMGVGDKLDTAKTTALPPGSVAIMQPKTTHFGWAREETIVQVHGMGPWGVTYVNPADDPMKK